MNRVFVTRAVPGDALDHLRNSGCAVDLWPVEQPPSWEELAERIAGADGAMTMVSDPINDLMLEGAPMLQVIANVAVGYDNVDLESASRRGVWVTNTPGVLAETVADFTFALLLSAARRVAESDRRTREHGWGAWSPTAFVGPDVFGATLGIIGMGEIGEAVARRARGFNMRVLYTSRTRKPGVEQQGLAEWASMDDLLGQADFVSLHTPLTPETRRFFGKDQLAHMKRSAILVNTARGGVIDQDALVEALQAGTIAGAALDVAEPEPLPLDHRLYSFDNVLITPHIGSASLATRSKMARMAAENILAVFRGERPPNPVNEPAPRNPRPDTGG
jgi:glyoxylate reductase